jgi:class 3 adenylate cyclase/tetratricopeptide (TPR) repeat protein
MSTEREQLELAIAALQAQRALLGNALVDAALGPMRARLASLTAEQELRYVTILFLDIVGSTNLSQLLDPEDVHLAMDSAMQRYASIITQHGGKVLKFAGDSVLAIFGAEVASEDDAERGVFAGLALLEEGRRHQEWIEQHFHHTGFNIRVGLHTGNVLLGGGVDAENNIRGLPVNVAARMEQSAPVGGLRISHDTYRHVRGVFDVEPQAPIAVKGVTQAMLTYLVLRSKPRAFRAPSRGIDGIDTHMVARDTELQILQKAFLATFTDPKYAQVHVVADAGVGKSRLLYEFENWAESRAEAFYFLQARAHANTQNQPYGLLRDTLAWRFHISDNDSLPTVKEKFGQTVIPVLAANGPMELATAHAHLLGHLLGIDYSESKHVRGIVNDGKQIRARGYHAAALFLREVTRQQCMPVLLVLDDLHWADRETLDFLIYCAQVNHDVPMLTVTLTRPTMQEPFTNWAGLTGAQPVELQPLNKHNSRLLVQELLKKLPQVPAVLLEMLISSADGNPFYMEELVKMLIDEGAILTEPEAWRVLPDKLLATHVPPTLTGILQARIDRLHVSQRRGLQHASVIGSVFWDKALLWLSPDSENCLGDLVQNGLVVPLADTSLDDTRTYAFAHQLLHQQAYDTLLKRAKMDLHGRVAQWLTAQTGVRAKDYLAIAARHFQIAGDYASACDYYAKAAEHAVTRHAHEGVFRFVSRGLEALQLLTTAEVPSSRVQTLSLHWRLLDVRERALDLEGKRDAQWTDIETLGELAGALDNDQKRCHVATRLCNFFMRTGNFVAMRDAARDSVELAQKCGAVALGLRGQQRLSVALTYLGDATAGFDLARDGLERSRNCGDRSLEALFLNALSVIADSQSDRVASLEWDEQDLLINRELGNQRNEAIAMTNLGSGWLALGAHSAARLYLEGSLQLACAVGDRGTEPNTLNALSKLALRTGDAHEARALAQTALDLAHDVKNPDVATIALWSLGRAHLALGQLTSAKTAFERACATADQSAGAVALDALAGLAYVALHLRDIPAAVQIVNDLLLRSNGGETLDGAESACLIRLVCWQVLEHANDVRALPVLESSYRKVMEAARSISDDTIRSQFLQEIPEHIDTVAQWTKARQLGS